MSYNLIYKLINSDNHKVYIGQTWRSLKERGDSGCGYKRCLYLGNAIKKYGWEKFSYQLLTVAHTQEAADYWEQYFIEKYNSIDPKFGYNLRNGGSKGKLSEETKRKISQSRLGRFRNEENPFFGGKHTEVNKRQMSLTRKGRIVSEETKRRLSISKSGNKNPNYGKHHSEETKSKIANRPYKRGDEHDGCKFPEAICQEIRKECERRENDPLYKYNNGILTADLLVKYHISRAQLYRIRCFRR